MKWADSAIQVCFYFGEWLNHDEYDAECVSTKDEAVKIAINLSNRKDCNARVVDFLNRFPAMFFENPSNLNEYTHKAR